MKKIFTVLLIALISFSSFTAGKLFAVQGSREDWENALYVIDLSDAPAKQRIAARDMIVNQVNKQLQDTTAAK